MIKNAIYAVTISAVVALSAPASAGDSRRYSGGGSDDNGLILLFVGMGLLLFLNGFGSAGGSLSGNGSVGNGGSFGFHASTKSPYGSASDNAYSRPKSRVIEKF